MNGTGSLLQLCAAILGVYAGAMLTEGFVLVPYWRSLSPAEFLAWYAANDARLLAFFSPLTIVAAVIALVAAIAGVWTRHPSRWASVTACVVTLTAVGTYFVYFEAVNASFSSASIAPAEVATELSRWAAWHEGRMALSLVALACAVLALRGREPGQQA